MTNPKIAAAERAVVKAAVKLEPFKSGMPEYWSDEDLRIFVNATPTSDNERLSRACARLELLRRSHPKKPSCKPKVRAV